MARLADAEAQDESATRLLTAAEAAAAAAAGDDNDEAAFSRRPSRPRIRAARWWQVRSPRRIVLLAAVVKFCIVGSGMLLLVPLFRLIEDAICHGYFDDTTPGLLDEMKCKEDGVQARLATFLGWSGFAGSIFTLVTAFPFGAMSDRIGRKPTALLALSGVVVSFFFAPVMLGPLKQHVRSNPYLLIWGSLFQLLGGGVPVLLSTLYAMAADVSTQEEKAASFLYLSLGAAAGGLLGPLLAGVLMNKFGPWVPIWIVIAMSPALICILLLLPETLTITAGKSHDADDCDDAETGLDAVKAHLARGLADLRASLVVLRNRNVPIVLVTSLIQNARMTAYSSTLVQYVSKNYGWSLGETSILLSPLGVLGLVVLGGLPKLAERLTSPRPGGARYTVFGKDLLLTRVSTAFLVAGGLVQGFSPNVYLFILGLVVSTLGHADSPLARATVSHYVPAEFTSRLYALMGMVEVLGSFIGAPALAFFFNVGLKRKGLYTGLPYLYVALLSSIALAALMFVTPPPRKAASGAATPSSGDGMDGLPSQGAIRL